MRAFAVDGFGQTGHVRELPDPTPGEGEVLVRIVAAGLNQTDIAVMAGMLKDYLEHQFPLVPGIDASGVVERVGPGVQGFREGDEVYGFVRRPVMGLGTLAERVALPIAGVQGKPASISHEQAAVIGHSGLTAVAAMEAAALRAGARVVMLGATGGVGSYATQLAERAGADVIAITRDEHAGYARSLGASTSIDYGTRDVIEAIGEHAPEGIDVLADLAGQPDLMGRLSMHVRPGGRVVSIFVPPDPEALAARGVEGRLATRFEAEDRFEELCNWIATGRVQLPAIQTFAFEDIADALALQATRHVGGKLAVMMA